MAVRQPPASMFRIQSSNKTGEQVMSKVVLALGVFLLLPQEAPATASTLVLASAAGAKLDSNLMSGGGTDDTAALQRWLDGAANGKGVHLVIDGPALVSGLNVYGNTTIECKAGGGLYLKGSSSRAIIRNAHRSRGAIVDEHIDVRGCFLNGNRSHQRGADPVRTDLAGMPEFPSNAEPDGTFISGLQFLGVNYLNIEGVTLWNIRAFGALIANASYVGIRDVIVDDGSAPDPLVVEDASVIEFAGTDGLHFGGPLRYVSIDSVKLRVGDDSIAFNANDTDTNDMTKANNFGPYMGQGPITDVTVSNVILMDSEEGIRFLSANERIDRVIISNVVGTVRDYFLTIGHWTNPNGLGNVGDIWVENVSVDRPRPVAWPKSYVDEGRLWYGEDNGGRFPFINVNARVNTVRINQVATKVVNDWPVLRMGPDAVVGTISAELTADDPSLAGQMIQLDEGARIDRLNLSLNWESKIADEGKNPIDSRGGTVQHLQWVHTPPMFVGGESKEGGGVGVVAITFSEDVKASNFKAGVSIKVNGRTAPISSADHKSRANVVDYLLKVPVGTNDSITWSYKNAEGSIQNVNGDQLLSVSEKPIGRHQYSKF
jgi:hypothetical protein